jgi:hypothetical protein
MEPLSGALADSLRRNRPLFNTKFAAATKSENPIHEQAFKEHVASTLDPIVRAVAAEFPERTDPVVDALFDLSLNLFRHNLLGPKAKTAAIPDAWRNLLPLIPRLLAREPARVAGSITNALYNLSRTRGTRRRDWIQALMSVGSSCQNAGELLDCGGIVAWRCGMAQYRGGALEKAAALSPSLASQTLGLPPGTTPEQIVDVIHKLSANPWITPQGALRETKRELKIMTKAGAFRGFGGQFLSPPKVQSVAGELVASDGTGSWRLHADVYNSLLQRCETQPPPLPSSVPPALPAAGAATIGTNGVITWQGQERRFPELAEATSVASTADTIAVTIATSHHLFLVGIA